MFLSEADVEKNTLRQGDIVSEIHILGAVNLKEINYGRTDAEPEKKLNWSINAPPKISDAIVVSHSCEIDKSNGMKVTSIILAPLRDCSTATSKEKMDSLINSNAIDIDDTTVSFLKYFYLEPNPILKFKNGMVADFSKCFSVRNRSYEYLLERKIAQLDSGAVTSMSLKLALYFYRVGNKEVA